MPLTKCPFIFKKEVELFNDKLPVWLEIYPDKWVLIRGSRMHGHFDTQAAAYTEGVKLFGNKPFFVAQVIAKQLKAEFPAHSTGLIDIVPQ